MTRLGALAGAILLAGLAAASLPGSPPPGRATEEGARLGSPPPRYDHVVVVVEENHSASQVLGAPYLSSLLRRGVLLTRSYAVTHPSEPNYIALFSGSTQGVTDDRRHDVSAPNLATSLLAAGLTAAGYSEGLPWAGYRGDAFGAYVRKHNPFAIFANLPGSLNLPFSSFPKADLASLPTVSLVIPNLRNDMHDGSVEAGDAWLKENIEPYAVWALAHNSLLIVTFDEGQGERDPPTDPIATILVGAGLKAGTTLDTPVTHYSVLRLIEAVYGLPYLGGDGTAAVIDGIWE